MSLRPHRGEGDSSRRCSRSTMAVRMGRAVHTRTSTSSRHGSPLHAVALVAPARTTTPRRHASAVGVEVALAAARAACGRPRSHPRLRLRCDAALSAPRSRSHKLHAAPCCHCPGRSSVTGPAASATWRGHPCLHRANTRPRRSPPLLFWSRAFFVPVCGTAPPCTKRGGTGREERKRLKEIKKHLDGSPAAAREAHYSSACCRPHANTRRRALVRTLLLPLMRPAVCATRCTQPPRGCSLENLDGVIIRRTGAGTNSGRACEPPSAHAHEAAWATHHTTLRLLRLPSGPTPSAAVGAAPTPISFHPLRARSSALSHAASRSSFAKQYRSTETPMHIYCTLLTGALEKEEEIGSEGEESEGRRDVPALRAAAVRTMRSGFTVRQFSNRSWGAAQGLGPDFNGMSSNVSGLNAFLTHPWLSGLPRRRERKRLECSGAPTSPTCICNSFPRVRMSPEARWLPLAPVSLGMGCLRLHCCVAGAASQPFPVLVTAAPCVLCELERPCRPRYVPSRAPMRGHPARDSGSFHWSEVCWGAHAFSRKYDGIGYFNALCPRLHIASGSALRVSCCIAPSSLFTSEVPHDDGAMGQGVALRGSFP
ncbi:hypothetical protein K438DRAFT_1943374 [Mycena galopus ATCC 62051]|nr:hypothetical protein K438DRAFT_1943374 [Mycena galopus ATCC 62051]